MQLSAITPATGTVISDATIPTANDTVTIGGQVYKFVATAAATANDVDLGANAAAALANLKAAINLDAGAGTLYGSATVANEFVVATDLTATELTVVAKVPGEVGNFITLAESGTHTSVSAATLTGGTGHIDVAIGEILAGSQLNAEVKQALLHINGDPSAE